MRKLFALALVLCSPAAFAQDKPPPTVGGKALVQVTPKATAPKGAAPKAKQPSAAAKLQACLEIDDETKERLTCYDAIVPPKPKAKPVAHKVEPKSKPVAHKVEPKAKPVAHKVEPKVVHKAAKPVAHNVEPKVVVVHKTAEKK